MSGVVSSHLNPIRLNIDGCTNGKLTFWNEYLSPKFLMQIVGKQSSWPALVVMNARFIFVCTPLFSIRLTADSKAAPDFMK